MDLWNRLQTIDTRIIHVLVFVLVLIPLVNPIGLPVQISEGTRQAYNAIDQIPPGSNVLWALENAAANDPELGPCIIAWFRHLMAKGCKIVTFAIYSTEAPLFVVRDFELLEAEYGYVYGEDYVILPYRAGMETAVAAIARDLHSVFPEDFFGNNLRDLPLTRGLTGIEDFDILLKSSGWGPDVFVRQMVEVYGIPMVANCTGIVAPGAQAYLSSGQILGLVAALAGAAEYEQLLGVPGAAAAAMDAQSTTHALTVVLVLVGNIAFFAGRSKMKGGQ